MRRSQSSRRSWPLPRPPKRDAEGWLQASAMASRPLGRRGGVARPAETRTQAPRAADRDRQTESGREPARGGPGKRSPAFRVSFFDSNSEHSPVSRDTQHVKHISLGSRRGRQRRGPAPPAPREPAARDGDIAAHPLSLSPPALRPHVTSLPSRDDEPPRRLVCTHKHTSLRPTLDASRPRRTPTSCPPHALSL